MDAQLHREWIEALRSDHYIQGRGALRSHALGEWVDSWCCLGVLLNLMVKPWAWETSTTNPYRDPRLLYSVAGLSAAIPHSLAQQIGLSEDEQHAFVHMNDCQRLSFRQIADIIEAQVPAGRAMTEAERFSFRMRFAKPAKWSEASSTVEQAVVELVDSLVDTSPLLKALMRRPPPPPKLKFNFLVPPPKWLTDLGKPPLVSS